MQQHLTPKKLALRWDIKESTLARWRTDGLGPPFMKIGRLILYSLEDIQAYECHTKRL